MVMLLYPEDIRMIRDQLLLWMLLLLLYKMLRLLLKGVEETARSTHPRRRRLSRKGHYLYTTSGMAAAGTRRRHLQRVGHGPGPGPPAGRQAGPAAGGL